MLLRSPFASVRRGPRGLALALGAVLAVPALAVPALAVPALAVPALAVPALAEPALAAAPRPSPSAPAPSNTAKTPAGLDALRSSSVFAFEKYHLANGLEVILQEDHRVPLVAVNVRYHVGSKDEVPGKTGFAHLFEHLMFQGSRNVGEDLFFKYLQEAGASSVNGTTNRDRTNYFETVPSNQLELALWLESDRMGTLLDHVGDKTLGEQRDVVKNERRQRYENAPYGLVGKVAAETLYPKEHPYHHLTIGVHQDLDAARLEDVHAFFRAYYVPSNATLALVGDFDTARAKAQIESYFGGLPKAETPKTVREPRPLVLTGEKRVRMEAGVELPRLVVTWAAAPAAHDDGPALDVLGDILAAGRSSRLERRLTHELALASTVFAGPMPDLLAGTFSVQATLFAGKDPDVAKKEIDAELERFRREGPTAAELARAKERAVTDAWRRLEGLGERAEAFNYANDVGGSPDFLKKELERTLAVRESDVKAVANKYLAAGAGRVVVSVVPNPAAPVAGRVVSEGAP